MQLRKESLKKPGLPGSRKSHIHTFTHSFQVSAKVMNQAGKIVFLSFDSLHWCYSTFFLPLFFIYLFLTLR